MSLQLVKLLDPITVVHIDADMNFKGEYDNTTDYTVGDVVTYQGSSYIMTTEAPAGTLPTDATKWGVIAEKGDTGDTGPTGPTGPAGADGTDGTDGVGVPPGGTTGQVLTKVNNTDYNTTWTTPSGGGGGGGAGTHRFNATKGLVLTDPGFNTVVFGTVEYQDGSDYDASTGIYTAPAEGLYHFDVGIELGNGGRRLVQINKNGNGYRRLADDNSGNLWIGAGGLDMWLDTGDTVDVSVYNAAQIAIGGDFTFFCGHSVNI